MTHVIAASLVLVGTVFSLLAAVGVLRMPDFYSRLQTSTKASTLGVGCIVVAAALEMGDPGSSARVLLVGAFLILTTPISAHMISRAAYAERVPLWHGAVIDEFKVHSREAAKDGGTSRVDLVKDQSANTNQPEASGDEMRQNEHY
jgi:multicomponent Na+:H+ antiporter subunit G